VIEPRLRISGSLVIRKHKQCLLLLHYTVGTQTENQWFSSDKEVQTECDIRTNFHYLTSTENTDRMKNMAAVIHCKDQQIARLHEKINRLVANQGIVVNQDTLSDLVSMMKEYNGLAQPVHAKFLEPTVEGSFFGLH